MKSILIYNSMEHCLQIIESPRAVALGSSHPLYVVLTTGHSPHTASQSTAQLSSYSVPAAKGNGTKWHMEPKDK